LTADLERATRASPRQRVLAVTSLLAGVALLAVSVVFASRNWEYLIVGIAAVAVLTGGGWWAVTRRSTRRVLGVVALVVGAAGLVVVVVRATTASGQPVSRAAIVIALVALTFGCARTALRHEVADIERLDATRARPPAHPVLICNPWSGGGKVEKFGLLALAEELGVDTVMLDHGLDLEQLARDAIARGADCLGMAGGDGSQALVASIAVEHGIPFVCVSAGTRNHFALDLGLDREDPRRSMYAFKDGIERVVDYATVNGRFFVNNVSLGVYATIVQQESYRDAKVETSTALLPEMLGSTERPFDLQFTDPDGAQVDGAYLIMVSNNPYALGPLDASQRLRLDTGTLGVFAVTGSSGGDAARLVTMSAIGQRRHDPNWHEFAAPTFEVRSRSGTAFAGVDGEALEMSTPLTFSIHPGGLTLLVPKGNLVVADRRRARQVSLGDLIALARGSDPMPGAPEVRSTDTIAALTPTVAQPAALRPTTEKEGA